MSINTLTIYFDEYRCYKITTEVVGYSSHGKAVCEYRLIRNDNEIIFSGRNLELSPLCTEDSVEACIVALSFLTIRVGDVEDSYFDNYTQEQLDFCCSFDCECLATLVNDLEPYVRDILKELETDSGFGYGIPNEDGKEILDVYVDDMHNWEIA